jgi:hypothetical protein
MNIILIDSEPDIFDKKLFRVFNKVKEINLLQVSSNVYSLRELLGVPVDEMNSIIFEICSKITEQQVKLISQP